MQPARTNTLDIRLPEGVVFSLPLAGPATRFVAWLIDLILCLGVLAAVNTVLRPLLLVSEDVSQAVSLVMFFVVPMVYGIAFEALWRGQTPGKRFLRLRVMDAGGLRLDARQVVIRNLLRVVDALPQLYLVGGAACLVTARAQRLGDLAADTVVVRAERRQPPDLAQIAAGKYNTLRGHPALAARLRQRIGPAEAGLALQALLRRNALDPGARVELFARMAARFRAAVPLPEALEEGLTDEQYVRNVVDVLFHARPDPSVGKAG